MKSAFIPFLLVVLGGCGEDFTPLLRFDVEPPGENCQEGGTAVHTGVDKNGDSQLSDTEITSTEFMCAGSGFPSGLYLESSDGKYIGEFAGTPDPSSFNLAVKPGLFCAYVYNPDFGLFYGVRLDTAKACNPFELSFSNNSCQFPGQVSSGYFSPGIHWGVIDPDTGNLYVAGESELRVELRSYSSAFSGECHSSGPSSVLIHQLVDTGENVDLGSPPIVIKRER